MKIGNLVSINQYLFRISIKTFKYSTLLFLSEPPILSHKIKFHYVESELIWACDGACGGGIACYAPSFSEASKSFFFVVGHFVTSGNKPTTYVVSPIDCKDGNTVFRRPESFTRLWKDSGSGAYRDGSFWRVNCPNGYGSLSDICKNGYSEPDKNTVWCIILEYLDDDLHDTWVWDSKGTVGNVDVNGGKSDLTRELMSVTTTHGAINTMKRIKTEIIGKINI